MNTAGVQIWSVCSNVSQKTAAAVAEDDLTQTGNYDRNFTAFSQTNRHRNKQQFSFEKTAEATGTRRMRISE